ncbi:MarR family winged helix-turn-helix transcriptional regulator [Namhaeicola litoreus]|uniref:MarR family winged helix-turn-helix transcriptional regulator n=1 Tax=Namhaeicola litoreus TaxID=1052145 RepID=A0ABW3Y4A0_9FLAO
MKREKTIDHALRATWQSVAKSYNEQAMKHESTMAMGMALLYIDQDTGTPSTALGPSMGMESTSLSRILKNMEEKGLIYREKNPEDGRGVLIKLTALGKEKREISKNTVLQFNNSIKENIDESKIEHFFEVTELINRLISEKAIF